MRKLPVKVRHRLFAGMLIAAGYGVPVESSLKADDWTDLEGTRTIQADFIGMWEDKVILRLTNGKKAAVEISKLNAASRLRAEELAGLKLTRRQERIAELKTESEVVATIPAVKAAAAFEEAAEGMDLATSLQYAANQVQAGHPRAIWELMPPSYQADLQELFRAAIAANDAKQYAANLRLGGQIARTLNKQREFVFGYPAMGMIPPEIKDIVEKAYGPVVGILAVLSDPQLMSIESLTTRELGEIIADVDEQAGPHIAALFRLVPEESNPLMAVLQASTSSVQMEGSDRGSIMLTNPQGQVATVVFVRVENRWVPEAMAQSWQEDMASARQAIAQAAGQQESVNAGMAAMTLTLGAMLTQLEDAETQDEFNQIIDNLASVFATMIPQNPGGGPFAGNPPGMNNPGGASGYGTDGMEGFNSGGVVGGDVNSGGGVNSGGSSGPPGIAPAGVNSGGS